MGRSKQSKEIKSMNSRRNQLIVSSLLLFAVVAACSTSPAGSSNGSTGSPAAATSQPTSTSASGECTNDYFPVSSGTTWSYSSGGGVLGDYTYSWTVADVSDAGFTTNDQSSLGTGTTSSVKWNCQGGNLAALDSGSNSLSLSTSKVIMTSTSVTAEGFNIPASFKSGNTWSEKVTAKGTVVSATKTVDVQIDSDLACSIAGDDTITVPAGTFDAVKTTCSDMVSVSELNQGTPMPAAAPSTVNITNWYAKGVGLLKSVRVSTAGGTATSMLTQYKIQK
jgi:hypothetical protein